MNLDKLLASDDDVVIKAWMIIHKIGHHILSDRSGKDFPKFNETPKTSLLDLMKLADKHGFTIDVSIKKKD